MRVIVHLKSYYDWAPVPGDVVVTPEDLAAKRVKPAQGGGWLMRVPIKGETYTTVMLPEEQIIAKIIHEKTRPEGGRVLTRKQAVAFYLSEHVMPHEAQRSWITNFEVHDDGPDEEMFHAMLGKHVDTGNVPESDIDEHLASYLDQADAHDHVAHLCEHFRVAS